MEDEVSYSPDDSPATAYHPPSPKSSALGVSKAVQDQFFGVTSNEEEILDFLKGLGLEKHIDDVTVIVKRFLAWKDEQGIQYEDEGTEEDYKLSGRFYAALKSPLEVKNDILKPFHVLFRNCSSLISGTPRKYLPELLQFFASATFTHGDDNLSNLAISSSSIIFASSSATIYRDVLFSPTNMRRGTLYWLVKNFDEIDSQLNTAAGNGSDDPLYIPPSLLSPLLKPGLEQLQFQMRRDAAMLGDEAIESMKRYANAKCLQSYTLQTSLIKATMASFEECARRLDAAASAIDLDSVREALLVVHYLVQASPPPMKKPVEKPQPAKTKTFSTNIVSSPVVLEDPPKRQRLRRASSAPPTPTVAPKRSSSQAQLDDEDKRECYPLSKQGNPGRSGNLANAAALSNGNDGFRGGYRGKNFDPNYRGRGRGRSRGMFRGGEVSRRRGQGLGISYGFNAEYSTPQDLSHAV